MFCIESFEQGLISIGKIEAYSNDRNLSFEANKMELRAFISLNRVGLPDSVVYSTEEDDRTFPQRAVEWIKEQFKKLLDFITGIFKSTKNAESLNEDLAKKLTDHYEGMSDREADYLSQGKSLTQVASLPSMLRKGQKEVSYSDLEKYLNTTLTGKVEAIIKDVNDLVAKVKAKASQDNVDTITDHLKTSIGQLRAHLDGNAPVKLTGTVGVKATGKMMRTAFDKHTKSLTDAAASANEVADQLTKAIINHLRDNPNPKEFKIDDQKKALATQKALAQAATSVLSLHRVIANQKIYTTQITNA